MRWGRRYLMCAPEHYEVWYSINPWMDTTVVVDRDRALEQWDGLVATLEKAGATVDYLEPVAGLPDMVFTANAGLVDGRTFIPARMRHPERRDEGAYAESWFRRRDFRIRELGEDPEIVQEGSGDALPFAGSVVAGYRSRSSAQAAAALARLVAAPVVPVELLDPRYYHIDLTFCPLDDRHALVVPSAWNPSDAARVMALVPEPLVLEAHEAATFCANSVVVDRTVVMPACPSRVGRQLEAWGFEVAVADVGEFIKAGGAVRCLTLALDVSLSGAVGAVVAEDLVGG
jgi:N-dimethylarginine dimethylaminohydrolase